MLQEIIERAVPIHKEIPDPSMYGINAGPAGKDNYKIQIKIF